MQKERLRNAALPHVKVLNTDTNRELFFKTGGEYRVNTNKLATTFILEPLGRNKAAAIACSALQSSQMHGADRLMLVLAADHLMADQYALVDAVGEAVGLAKKGSLVTFGIRPDSPETCVIEVVRAWSTGMDFGVLDASTAWFSKSASPASLFFIGLTPENTCAVEGKVSCDQKSGESRGRLGGCPSPSAALQIC